MLAAHVKLDSILTQQNKDVTIGYIINQIIYRLTRVIIYIIIHVWISIAIGVRLDGAAAHRKVHSLPHTYTVISGL